MEEQSNEIQRLLLDLYENKSFDELNSDERNFVLSHLSKEEYTLLYQSLMESASIHDDLEPRPLILKPNHQHSVRIPLYLAIGGMAASFVLAYFIFRQEVQVEKSPPALIAQTDTVYLDKHIVDTVIEYRIRQVETRKEQSQQDRVSTSIQMMDEEAYIFPRLRSFDVVNRGNSAADDETNALIPDINGLQ